MKILIAYDGSASAKNAIQDLKFAGLPSEGIEATVLSVGEVRMRSEHPFNLEPSLSIASYALDNVQETMQYALEAAEFDATEGRRQVEELFPKWDTTSCARVHSPASTILEIADTWKPDLIVMGSHGRGAIGRLFLGSVSLRVASEAHTSVRITRSAAVDLSPTASARTQTILLAFDGSRSSNKVVHKMLRRSWPKGTRLHIVTVIDVSIVATPQYVWIAAGDLGLNQEIKESRIENSQESLARELQKYFAHVTTAMPVGSANIEILNEAKRVGAHTIFIGSRGLSGFERMLLGSVAHGVAAHAEATVEIVR